jgi:hypothetical protein
MKSTYKPWIYRTRNIALSLLVALATAACGTEAAPGEEIGDSQLELTYISGHLGNDWDCGAGQGSSAAKADMAMGACLPDPDGNCEDFGPMNCEEGEVTLQFRNVGESTIVGLEVTDLELLALDLSYLKGLDIGEVSRPDGHDFDGTLEPGAIIQIRVTFQSPGGQGTVHQARLRVIVLDKNGQTTEITTPEVQTLPVVAT